MIDCSTISRSHIDDCELRSSCTDYTIPSVACVLERRKNQPKDMQFRWSARFKVGSISNPWCIESRNEASDRIGVGVRHDAQPSAYYSNRHARQHEGANVHQQSLRRQIARLRMVSRSCGKYNYLKPREAHNFHSNTTGVMDKNRTRQKLLKYINIYLV